MWTEGVLLVLPHPQIKTSIDSGDFAMRAIPAVQNLLAFLSMQLQHSWCRPTFEASYREASEKGDLLYL